MRGVVDTVCSFKSAGGHRADVGALIRFSLSTGAGLKPLTGASLRINQETRHTMPANVWHRLFQTFNQVNCGDPSANAACYKVSSALRLSVWSHVLVTYETCHMTGPLTCFMSVPPHQTKLMQSSILRGTWWTTGKVVTADSSHRSTLRIHTS